MYYCEVLRGQRPGADCVSAAWSGRCIKEGQRGREAYVAKSLTKELSQVLDMMRFWTKVSFPKISTEGRNTFVHVKEGIRLTKFRGRFWFQSIKI